MKILICGDSFSSFPKPLKCYGFSWVNQLDSTHDLTNLSQPGCSEYKIWKQLQSQNPDDYDFIFVFHTSPNRLYIKHHPKYKENRYHRNADLIYSDIEKSQDPKLVAAQMYFEHLYEEEYALEMHQLLCEKIESYLALCPVVHCSSFDYQDIYDFKKFISINDVFTDHRGDISHLTEYGNHIVYDRIIASIMGGDLT